MVGKRSTLHWALGLFMLALAIRLVFFYPVRYNQPESNAGQYDRIAWNLVQGNGYSLDGNSPTAYRSPAFPMLLAAVYALLGRNWFAARVLAATLSALTVSIVFLTGVRLFNHKTGVISAVIAAFYPEFLHIVAALYSESLFNFLLALSVLMLIKVGEEEARARDKLTAGLCLGLAILARPEPILLFPFLVAWAFWITNLKVLNAIKLIVPILLPGIILVSIWAVRNYYAMQAFIPTTTGGGAVMLGVYNDLTFTDPCLRGQWINPEELDHWDEFQRMPEVERDRALFRTALTLIGRNLKRLPRLQVYKLHNFVFGYSPGRVVKRFPIVFFAIPGLIISWLVARKKYSVIYTLLLYYLTNVLIFYANERIRTAIELYLFIFAVFGAFEYLRFLAYYYKARPTNVSTVTELN